MLRVLDGTLRPEEAACAEDHIDECVDCRALIVAWARAQPVLAAGNRYLTIEVKPRS